MSGEEVSKKESKKSDALDLVKGIASFAIMLVIPAIFFVFMKVSDIERDNYKAKYDELYEENCELESEISDLEDDYEEGYAAGYQDGYSDAL